MAEVNSQDHQQQVEAAYAELHAELAPVHPSEYRGEYRGFTLEYAQDVMPKERVRLGPSGKPAIAEHLVNWYLDNPELS